ncbi:YpoC family protein [Neobacillus terrae]|uniref:YpoC family protein n=1 Tax=Neobacillus terrae TaxID=3034837 RepID=UPI001409B86C|nr:hypothetical protein [Neobacillus terrae]NHM29159.1 hypothetical protein [Neobacillus terrae]
MDRECIKIKIPDKLTNPFFFPEKEIVIKVSPSGFDLNENFIYDILFFLGEERHRPWEHLNEALPILRKEWEKIKITLEELHTRRDKSNTLPAMKKGIGVFLQFLFWSNEKPVILKSPIPFDSLVYKPVNVEERLGFIISRPGLFHSFIQLGELMEEQKKQNAIRAIKKKASKL